MHVWVLPSDCTDCTSTTVSVGVLFPPNKGRDVGESKLIPDLFVRATTACIVPEIAELGRWLP
jgi:hypothetical protein